jgi:hypothetical protein
LASVTAAETVVAVPDAIEAPDTAGLCVPQTGGEFLTTVQVCDEDVPPLVTVACRKLAPVKKLDDGKLVPDVVPVSAVPLSFQLTAQFVSDGVTEKLLPVAEAGMRTLLDEGEYEESEHAVATETFHEQTAES